MSKKRKPEELVVDADIPSPAEVSAFEIMLLQSHFSELLKDVLMHAEKEEE